MFLFRNHKNLSQKQKITIGFVLAVMSILVMAITVYVFPRLSAWLYVNGVYQLDMFLLMFIITIFLAAQGLILFGFPLYYAKDKKCHMTGFQLLLYALGWMIVLVVLVSLLAVGLMKEDYGSYDLDDFDWESLEVDTVDEVDVVDEVVE
jgi:hypothetical protein